MKECFVLFNTETNKFYSESEFMWSVCVGTFYPSQEAARAVMQRDHLDPAKVRTVHLYDY